MCQSHFYSIKWYENKLFMGFIFTLIRFNYDLFFSKKWKKNLLIAHKIKKGINIRCVTVRDDVRYIIYLIIITYSLQYMRIDVDLIQTS